MTSAQIRSFLVLARHLNFSSAAKELCISQSTLSMHIAALEKNLGVQLFIRDRRNVALSPQGELLRPVFEQTQTMISDALSLAARMQEQQGTLRIGQMVGMRLHEYLNDVLQELQSAYPVLRTNIVGVPNQEIRKELDEGAIDIVILPERNYLPFAKYESAALFDSQVSIIYPAGEKELSFSASALSRETFIIISPEINPAERQYLDQLSERHGFRPAGITECRSAEDQLAYVRLGRGVCIADHTSRIYGSREYRICDLPGEFTRCIAVKRKEDENPVIRDLFHIIGNRYQSIRKTK